MDNEETGHRVFRFDTGRGWNEWPATKYNLDSIPKILCNSVGAEKREDRAACAREIRLACQSSQHCTNLPNK